MSSHSARWDRRVFGSRYDAPGLEQATLVGGAPIACNTARSAPWSKPHPQLTAFHPRSVRNCATSPCSDKVEHKDRLRSRVKFEWGL